MVEPGAEVVVAAGLGTKIMVAPGSPLGPEGRTEVEVVEPAYVLVKTPPRTGALVGDTDDELGTDSAKVPGAVLVGARTMTVPVSSAPLGGTVKVPATLPVPGAVRVMNGPVN